MACNEGKAGPATCRSLGAILIVFASFCFVLARKASLLNWSLPSQRVG